MQIKTNIELENFQSKFIDSKIATNWNYEYILQGT